MPLIKRTIAMAQLNRVDCASMMLLGAGKRSAATRAYRIGMKAGHDGDEMYMLIWSSVRALAGAREQDLPFRDLSSSYAHPHQARISGHTAR